MPTAAQPGRARRRRSAPAPRDLRPDLHLIYHSTTWHLPEFVKFINRAKDELVTPDDFDAFVAEEQPRLRGPIRQLPMPPPACWSRATSQPVRDVRGEYAKLRRNERAEALGKEPRYDPRAPMKTADREARRTVAGTGRGPHRSQIPAEDCTRDR